MNQNYTDWSTFWTVYGQILVGLGTFIVLILVGVALACRWSVDKRWPWEKK